MPSKASEPNCHRRILIVDDDDLMLTFYKSLFSRHSGEFSPFFEETGEGALQQLKTSWFDAAILDWDMPRLSGLSILKAIRANPDTRAMQVIMISGRSDSGDRARALKGGADDFMAKPFDVQTLLTRLRAPFRH